MKRFGTKSRLKTEPSDLVMMMDVSIMMDKTDGRRFVALEGEYMDGDNLRFLLSPKFARSIAETILKYLDEEKL